MAMLTLAIDRDELHYHSAMQCECLRRCACCDIRLQASACLRHPTAGQICMPPCRLHCNAHTALAPFARPLLITFDNSDLNATKMQACRYSSWV